MNAIVLKTDERRTLLDLLRKHPDARLRLRAHIILLLADGHTWADIALFLYCSSRTIARWQHCFAHGRIPALYGRTPGAPLRLQAAWLTILVTWVTTLTPRAFGFFRSRWSCELLALLLWQQYKLDVSRETVRRYLRDQELVWRRPRPVLQRRDPRRQEILQELRQLLLQLPDDETVVFEDEVDLQLNPKVGSMWMRRGQQTALVTPGDNDKRYLAGSWHWRTGTLLTTLGPKRDGHLFVRHLHDLRRKLRRYQKIHVILDNAKFHDDCWEVWEFCAQHGDRVVLHYLPKYAPELNPIERVWWILHEQVTRCHQCQSLEELVDLVLGWLTDRRTFKLDTAAYKQKPPYAQAA
jgi:transposase